MVNEMRPDKPLPVVFYRSENGNEPVRDWLKGLTRDERRIIGEDIKMVQFGWPLGMPLERKIDLHLWEVRSTLPGKIARILLTVQDGTMVLLHGFIKKDQKLPTSDKRLALTRLSKLRGVS
jgi:phage-related protein